MVVQKIKDIDTRKIKMAKQVLAVFELLGINEEDVSAIKDIICIKGTMGRWYEELKQELEAVKENQKELMTILKNVGQGGTVKKAPIDERIFKAYGQRVEEFNPNGARK